MGFRPGIQKTAVLVQGSQSWIPVLGLGPWHHNLKVGGFQFWGSAHGTTILGLGVLAAALVDPHRLCLV